VTPALYRHYPALGQTVPRVPLAELPTPVDEVPVLADRLGLNALTIKRDDVSAPLYGGNKVRKLEFVLADVVDRGCDAILTYGAAGSNHVLATAIYASRMQLRCYAVLTDQPASRQVAATLRYHGLLGTHLTHAGDYASVGTATEALLDAHPGGRDRVYTLTWGGSSWRGTAGFVSAALELSDQLGSAGFPDVIYTACGTMGTAAGLAVGLRLAGRNARIEAIQVTPPAAFSAGRFMELCTEVNRELHSRDSSIEMLDDPMRNVRIRTEFFGDGYAHSTAAAKNAVSLINETHGLTLETTYTGKALAALVADARSGVLAGLHPMFWNTYNSRPFPPGLRDAPTGMLPGALRAYLRTV